MNPWAFVVCVLAVLCFVAVVVKAPQHWWLPLGLALFVVGFALQIVLTSPTGVHF